MDGEVLVQVATGELERECIVLGGQALTSWDRLSSMSGDGETRVTEPGSDVESPQNGIDAVRLAGRTLAPRQQTRTVPVPPDRERSNCGCVIL